MSDETPRDALAVLRVRAAAADNLADALREIEELGERWLFSDDTGKGAMDMESWRQAAQARAGMVRDAARDALAAYDAAKETT